MKISISFVLGLILVLIPTEVIVFVNGSSEDTEQSCLRRGAPRSSKDVAACAWHDFTIEDKFRSHVCEPSEVILESIITLPEALAFLNTCTNRSFEECSINLFDEDVCASDSNNKTNCFTPPLLVLQSLLGALTPTFPELEAIALKKPLFCASHRNNASCLAETGCNWSPERNTSIETFFPKSSGNSTDNGSLVSTVEKQRVSLTYPEESINAKATASQLVEAKAADYATNVLTLTRLLNVTEGQTFRFRFSLDENTDLANYRETAEISYDADSAEIKQKLIQLIGDETNTDDITVYSQTSYGGHKAWEITFPRDFQTKRIELVDRTSPLKLFLSRHERNIQVITLYATTSHIQSGQFLVKHHFYDPSSLDSTLFERESSIISLNFTEFEVSRALYNIKYAGESVMKYVHVKKIKHDNEAEGELAPRLSWEITFSTNMDDEGYEAREYPLETATATTGCIRCESFALDGSNGSVEMDVTVVVNSPRLLGTVFFDRCKFDTVFHGLAFPTHGSTTVSFLGVPGTETYGTIPIVGDPIKILGHLYKVTSVGINSVDADIPIPRNESSRLVELYAVEIDKPFEGRQDVRNGTNAFGCIYIKSKQIRTGVSLDKVRASLSPLLLSSATDGFDEEVIVSSIHEQNKLGEFTWNITILNVIEEIPPIRGFFQLLPLNSVNRYAENRNYNSTNLPRIVTEILETGEKKGIDGFFRLAFAGYTSNGRYVNPIARSYHFDQISTVDLNPEESQCISLDLMDNNPPPPLEQVKTTKDCNLFAIYNVYVPYSKLCFTRAIPWDASERVVKDALSELCNLYGESIQVTRKTISSTETRYGNNNTTHRSKMNGFIVNEC